MMLRTNRPTRGARGKALLGGFLVLAIGVGGCANEAPPAPVAAMPAVVVMPTPVAAQPTVAPTNPTEIASKTGTEERAPTPAPTPAASEYAVGERVSVEWHGSWYPASILRVNSNGTYRIHYTGWESSWDESVGVRRLRH